jgi:hypothetical protein
MFASALARRTSGSLNGTAAVADTGVRFESPEFVQSVAHAFGIAAAAKEIDSSNADRIADFVGGIGEYANVPQALRAVNVFSVMSKDEAARIGSWLKNLDRNVFREEVESMFGQSAIAVYEAAGRDLQRLFQSVMTHDADLCCVASGTP